MESRTITSRIAELRPLAGWAREVAAREGCAPGVCDDVDQCLHEAVVNVMLHGYQTNAAGEITVTIERSGGALRVWIEDGARPFDPTSVPPPEPVPLEQASAGGRGLVLIRGLTSAMRYERRRGLNRLMLEFEVRGPG